MLVWNWDFDLQRWVAREIPVEGMFFDGDTARIIYLPRGSMQHSACALLSRGRVLVNGMAALPFVVLANRDEIECGGRTYYVANDSAAEPLAYESTGREVRCARCQSRLTGGEQTIRCPGCGAYHHRTCWHYEQSPGCQKCKHPASHFAWSPEQLS